MDTKISTSTAEGEIQRLKAKPMSTSLKASTEAEGSSSTGEAQLSRAQALARPQRTRKGVRYQPMESVSVVTFGDRSELKTIKGLSLATTATPGGRSSS
jgi:hypothetical protein